MIPRESAICMHVGGLWGRGALVGLMVAKTILVSTRLERIGKGARKTALFSREYLHAGDVCVEDSI